MDYFRIYRALEKLCRQNAFDLIICRSALSGAFGHRLHKNLGIKYIVESFEPHRDYMVESNVWKWYDPRAIVQSIQERRQKGSARYLLPVSYNYANQLLVEGISAERIQVVPCCIDTEKFVFSEIERETVRVRNGISAQAVVGIYVGKFGGIYYWKEAFRLYKQAFDFFGESFFLVILSPHDEEEIDSQLKINSIPANRVLIRSVPHDEVNGWLCAADFAFCTIKPAPSRKFCSPVKNGEYWACGLPVMMELGIGDDSQIIVSEGGGVIMTIENHVEAFMGMQKLLLLGRANLVKSIRCIAMRYRHPQMIRQTYDKVLFGR